MFQYFKSFGLALVLSVGFGSVGKAASFDCNKAITETEIAICNDPELSALDELMSVFYKLGINQLGGNSLSRNFWAPNTAVLSWVRAAQMV